MKIHLALIVMACAMTDALADEPKNATDNRQNTGYWGEKSENLMNVSEKKHVLSQQDASAKKPIQNCTSEQVKAANQQGNAECDRVISTEFNGKSLYHKGRSKVFPHRNIAPSFVDAQQHRQSRHRARMHTVYSRSHCHHPMVGYSSLGGQCR